jgi:hypothetical protein
LQCGLSLKFAKIKTIGGTVYIKAYEMLTVTLFGTTLDAIAKKVADPNKSFYILNIKIVLAPGIMVMKTK